MHSNYHVEEAFSSLSRFDDLLTNFSTYMAQNPNALSQKKIAKFAKDADTAHREIRENLETIQISITVESTFDSNAPANEELQSAYDQLSCLLEEHLMRKESILKSVELQANLHQKKSGVIVVAEKKESAQIRPAAHYNPGLYARKSEDFVPPPESVKQCCAIQ